MNKAKSLRKSLEKGAQLVRPLELVLQGGALEQHDVLLLEKSLTNLESQTAGIERILEELAQRYHSSENSAKFRIWERKLLDLSLRNNLLNMHVGKSAIALSEDDIANVEDRLYNGEELPLEGRAITQLYRTARNHIEETGANALFLSLGTLVWQKERGGKECKAPILLMPVELIKVKGRDSYMLRKRDEDTSINITLLELLKSEFDISVMGVNPLPTDEYGIDVSLVLHRFREAISEREGWHVCEEAILGAFSFTKFVMWNDIHNNSSMVVANPIVRSLIDGSLAMDLSVESVDMKTEDEATSPAAHLIPLDADSSQIKAVIEAEQGRSFILNGPPGTGKSQSITNIIANALYHGKRVLFVAQKRAALSVVKSRLDRLGLAPFCLELHSNKIDKRYFLQQMQVAIDACNVDERGDFERIADELFTERKRINFILKALHKKRDSGYSLYECIEQYMALNSAPITIPDALLKEDNATSLESIMESIVALDANAKMLGVSPSEHPLFGMLIKGEDATRAKSISYGMKESLEDILKALPPIVTAVQQQIERNKKMAYFSKTTRQYIEADYKLKRLFQYVKVDDALMDDIDAFVVAANRWAENISLLPQWREYSRAAERLESMGLGEVYERYVKGESAEALCSGVKCGYFKVEAERIISHEPLLSEYNNVQFSLILNKYNVLCRELQRVARQELVYRLSGNVLSTINNTNVGAELTLLRKRIGNKGRGATIRSMIDQMPNLLGKLCPVMLMSPLSVAQYISAESEKFDLVIFDEASQMETCDAIGSIARAKASVIVGDTKQMPPTSFFSQTLSEDADVDDMESILDDCIALSMPTLSLNWHYRSDHEDLIAFSNRHYYGDSLITFPSTDFCSHLSIEHVDGYYDAGKTRTNRAEAEAIVSDIINRLKSNPRSSIGVVAFSMPQSNLIEDLLAEAFSANPDLEHINAESEEPLFIKNLENVQGDERDVILFSIGYGPDKDGKISMNFGPLNKMGGERRLNVAITRARREMKIFSTLRSDDIDERRTQAEGVLGLKAFLSFAESRDVMSQVADTNRDHDIVTQQIAAWLHSQGYDVRCDVGVSKCRVDVAVLDPATRSRYILGIIGDGRSYNMLDTARDKEIVRPAILRRLGWNLLRVGIVDWLKSNESVKSEILQTLRQLR